MVNFYASQDMLNFRNLLLLLFLLPLYSQGQTAFCSGYTSHAPINETGHSNETISGDSILVGSSAPGIYLTNCHDIHITKSHVTAGSSSVPGAINGIAIVLVNCYNITVDSCFLNNVVSGVYAQNCTGGIVVINNRMQNVKGPYPRGQFVQLNSCSGGGNRIKFNKLENFPGASNPEDGINIYKSNGLATDSIEVVGNWIRGGGPSTTGSGITCGDQGGSYEYIAGNYIVNSGYIGIQVAGGHDIHITNNYIFGACSTVSHLGLGSGNYTIPYVASYNNIVDYNHINWTQGFTMPYCTRQDKSSQAGQPIPAGWSTNVSDNTLTSAIIPTPMWSSCTVIFPPNISYSPSSQSYTQYTAISSWTPTNSGGAAVSWSISPSQPAGLLFNSTTGVISGAPITPQSSTSYVVTATNTAGNSNKTIYITVTASAGGVIRVSGIKVIIK